MRFPLSLTTDMVGYIGRKKLSGAKRFPLVLMLEPLHACNLTCTGCGRIREYEDTIKQKLSVEECLASVDEAGAPIVSICGGEPMIYPEIGALVKGILRRRKHIYLCTNGMFTKKKLHEFRPSDRFFFNVHLDGLEQTHDKAVERDGVFKSAVEGIVAAKKAGFLVCTNTTIFKETNLMEIEMLFTHLEEIGVDGLLVAPGFGYEAVGEKLFLERREIEKKFAEVYEMSKKHRFYSTPMYLRFLKGEKKLDCTPWGNPTRNPRGWKAPCYLITDTHYPTFREMMEKTDWGKYGVGKDPRCAQCMMHCGFEPTVVSEIGKSFKDIVEMMIWNLT